MIAIESKVSRRIVGRLVSGEDALRGLVEVCRRFNIHAGEVRMTGALRSADICEYDQGRKTFRPPRRLEAPLEMLSCIGNISSDGAATTVHLMLHAARELDAGVVTFGGRLLSGNVFACEFVIESWDDVTLTRTLDRETGLHLWSLAAPLAGKTTGTEPAKEVRGVGGAVGWADAVAASTQLEKPLAPPRREVVQQEDLGFEPEAGDLVEHPQFGRCRVETCDPADDRLVLRLPTGRVAELKLSVVTFAAPREVDGKQVFPVRVVVRR